MSDKKEAVEPIQNYALKITPKNKNFIPNDNFSKIGIVGCGILGQEITRMVSSSGLEVVFLEISNNRIEQVINEISRDLDRMIGRWGMTKSEKRAILSRITGTTDYTNLKGADIVIESVKSRTRESSVDLRKRIFKSIEDHVGPETIIATNSTTLVITELSSELERPERCVSLHFLSPADQSQVVEVARGLYTSEDTYQRVIKFARMFNKKVVPVIESPGVISTRLIAPLINEACEILMEGVGSMEDIDATMRLGFGFPLGPFEIADKIGLDTVVRWLENMYKEYGDLKYKASPLLKKKVRANQLGKDTGRGFYSYDEVGNKNKNLD
ncbi:MAG TPA: 3-hydroxybutyryl-CoA dehydrogenase [Cytophagales bacterium]|jgi:3-hydroxybutyryl-CoA dehydrogenase|nr:3-hydroxybutyryl-CoA dehydrogenase [Cytophagales bacterium]